MGFQFKQIIANMFRPKPTQAQPGDGTAAGEDQRRRMAAAGATAQMKPQSSGALTETTNLGRRALLGQ